ncbi:hypothetical protein H9Q70_010392 [Fusarium xylarioides]|nr:hypothetical protein H9Q70_010392 [Fusarium xylarioides]KAG5775965.1 hypothetical protein H9Q73_010361 [Fusarium xylarioides]
MAAQANPPEPMEGFKEREIYYSFGDDGLTATVDANGFLLQMSRYFPDREHNTGYCIDAPDTDKPFLVASRIQQLYARATGTYSPVSIGPSIDFELDLIDPQPPEFTHDRWPNFVSISEEGVILSTQYLVSDHTLFRTWELDYIHSDLPRNIPSITAAKDLLIRNLDFVSWSNEFNNQKEGDETYETKILAEGESLMRRHIDSDNPSNSVALFSSVFHDEEYVNFTKVEDGFQLIWSEKCASTFRETGRFKITTAYTLECEPAEDLPKIPPVSPKKFTSSRERLDNCDYKPVKFADDLHLDFTLRRNLEHILSVCSIPVTKRGDQAIALTCGDFDGHRIATAASFFFYRLSGISNRKAADVSLWENLRSKCQDGRQSFERGKKIENNGYLPEKCLTDTPFHIIKVGDFYKFYKEHEDVDIATAAEFPKYMGISLEDIQPVIDSWIADIDRQNKMGLYAFPSHKKEHYQTFYVTDHAFIWRAIKSAEDLGFQSRLRILPTNRTQGEIKKSQSRALDESHEPLMYQAERDRDTYWGITFEIPYILWVYNAENPTSQSHPDAIHSKQSHEGPSQTVPHIHCHSCEGICQKQLSDKQHIGPLVPLMKQSNPFNHVVYQENIVELSDEWLYNKPSFFRNSSTEQSVAPSMGSDQGSRLRSGTNTDLDGFRNEESWRHNYENGKSVGGIVIDIPKSKKAKTTSKNPGIYFTYVLLHTTREVEKIMECK